MNNYDTATICLNGHVITEYSSSERAGDPYCSDCGAAAIRSCESCGQPIRGHHKGSAPAAGFTAPAYCHCCGAAYPWTRRILEKAEQLIETDESLSRQDKDALLATTQHRMTDGASEAADAPMLKKYLGKAGKFVKDALYKHAVDMVSGNAKKTAAGD